MPDDIEFFEDPTELFLRPKAEVRFLKATLAPYADGRRVRLSLQLTPFEEQPNVEVEVTNSAGAIVSQLTVIENTETDFEITLHLRGPQPAGAHQARLSLYYATGPESPREEVAQFETTFEILPPE